MRAEKAEKAEKDEKRHDEHAMGDDARGEKPVCELPWSEMKVMEAQLDVRK